MKMSKDRVVVPEAAKEMILEKVRAAQQAALAQQSAMALVMAALGCDPADGWQWEPDAGALVKVGNNSEEVDGGLES